ncbi:MAG: formylglycine-generating enzyme family protein, partial [Planctomycetia bacterium]
EYRLPTEAEWEFACRAGTGSRYSFGESAELLGDHAWFGGGWNADGPVPGGNTASMPHAHAVGLKAANPWGIFDVHGNVWEWVADWQADRVESPVTDPQGPPTGSFRGYRGGSFTTPPAYCRSGFRSGFHPGYRGYDVGFRLAFSPAAGARGESVRRP